MQTSLPRPENVWSAELRDYPVAMEFSCDGRLLAVGGAEGHVQLLDGDSGAVIARWTAHRPGVQCLAWHPHEALLASGGQDGRARLWRVPQGELLREVHEGSQWVDHLAFNAQGTMLASAAGRQLILAGVDGGVLANVTEHKSTITGLAWRPNGEQLLSACYGGLQAILAPSGQVKRRLAWQGSMLNLALSPNGKIAACGCQDNSVHFWRLANGQDAMMAGYPAKPAQLSWRADGGMLATSGAASVTVWNFAGKGPEGTRPLVLQGHDELLTAVAFAPRGAQLATGCRAGRVLFWVPGRLETAVAAGGVSAAVAHLRWATYGERMQLAIADVAGRVDCWQF